MVAHPWVGRRPNAAFLLNGPAMAFVTGCLEKILEASRFGGTAGVCRCVSTQFCPRWTLSALPHIRKIGSGVRRNRTLSLIAANIEHRTIR
jgi:hypothetical protein